MGIRDWAVNIAIKKSIVSAVKLVVAFLSAGSIGKLLNDLGVEINQEQMTLGLTIMINSGLTIVKNYIKVKYGIKFI